MENGAGYNSHPTDCEKFVQCKLNGVNVALGEVVTCPFATYWSEQVLACIAAEKVDCPNEKCLHKADAYRYRATQNCRGFWECRNGRAVPYCCAPGHRYVNGQGCVEDKKCKAKCFNDPNEMQDCDMRPMIGDKTKFEQYVPHWGWQVMPCAPGTDFLQSLCSCAVFDPNAFQERECRPEIYLPFDGNTMDQSGRYNYVQNEGVRVSNGVGIFDGQSRLIIPRFTNLEHSDTIVINATYRSRGSLGLGQRRALVSNADCDFKPSILITEDGSDVRFEVRTSDLPSSVVVPQDANADTKHISYVFYNGELQGSTLSGSKSAIVHGTLRNVRCALHIGHAQNFENFVGEIDEITVYLCKPKNM